MELVLATVRNTGEVLKVAVGPELLGRVLDGIGRPMDEGEIVCKNAYPIDAMSPDPLKRKLISEILPLV